MCQALNAAAGADKCTSQESSLALLWTLGIFTLNCGPVAMGFVLDFLGPKLTGILGAYLTSSFGVRASCSCFTAAIDPCVLLISAPQRLPHSYQAMPGCWHMVAPLRCRRAAQHDGSGAVWHILVLGSKCLHPCRHPDGSGQHHLPPGPVPHLRALSALPWPRCLHLCGGLYRLRHYHVPTHAHL